MDALLCLLVMGGTWLWVVKQRGEWNLLLANLAGAGSSVVTGIVFTLIYGGLIGTSMATTNLDRSLVVFMASAGVLAGVWMWVANRRQPEHPIARQLLGAVCGFTAGMITLMFLAVNYFPNT
ncbi:MULTISPECIES: hypothetical protein [Pseudomonas]|jgi:hypothetical protein|uniref:Uncharacterized protein n=1 Tax=Pseudomonas fluorescens TaxID=294 RepID=A0A5E7LPZ2_PSEFL|nr:MULTISPECIES: hypothetical protein [Pseudomonas]MCF5704516.1 hypothetical protein [Pseudomonas syringae]MCP1486352.1 high-affinity Fe2+/Pb2+ permease [Pseudomonas fluorescens]PRB48973.1 hypothetical protein CQ025_11990 [Pseudomonas sp. MYb3]PRC33951.1 hypothetical protein CQ009_14925 [Pseudomonas sp. MYb2]VVP13748.1 hypothetical protein PS896_03476 [Pseudomonas fluorescens]